MGLRIPVSDLKGSISTPDLGVCLLELSVMTGKKLISTAPQRLPLTIPGSGMWLIRPKTEFLLLVCLGATSGSAQRFFVTLEDASLLEVSLVYLVPNL